MIYGYARVSTRTQVQGNSLEEQEGKLRDAGAVQVVSEQYTGKTTDRPKFSELVKTLKQGDVLAVTKLDRLARNTKEGIEVIDTLAKRGVKVNILNMGTFEDTPNGKLMRTMLLAFAEYERDMIITRMAEGKAIAKTKAGFHEGRPRISKARTDGVVKQIANGEMTYRQAEEQTGISKRTLIRRVQEYRKSLEA